MQRDLRSPRLIVAKGIGFALIVLVSFILLLAHDPEWRTFALLAILVWAACRFYYFLFYVLEHYVDPTLRYAGLISLARAAGRRCWFARQGARRSDSAESQRRER